MVKKNDTIKMGEEDRLRLKISGEMVADAQMRQKIAHEHWEKELARIRTTLKIPPTYNALNIDEGTFKKVEVEDK